jgi:hypothetical protein
MGKRKSYKRKREFRSEEEMLRTVRAYHDEVIRDLIADADRPGVRWKRVDNYHSFQRSRLVLGSGEYNLTTTFSEHGEIRHTLDKIGATNHLVRARLWMTGVNRRA